MKERTPAVFTALSLVKRCRKRYSRITYRKKRKRGRWPRLCEVYATLCMYHVRYTFYTLLTRHHGDVRSDLYSFPVEKGKHVKVYGVTSLHGTARIAYGRNVQGHVTGEGS